MYNHKKFETSSKVADMNSPHQSNLNHRQQTKGVFC